MTDTQNSREDLHAVLDAILDAADMDKGRLDPDAFWTFAAMLAQGRGITERLHEAGIEALRATPDSPRNTHNERQRRAYHIGLTAALLAGAGRLPGQVSILPANYLHGVVIQDLLWMLGGDAGTGEAEPLILKSGKGGEAGLRKAARRRLVGVVRWRMGATGKTRAQVWEDLMGHRAEKITIDRWQRQCGGATGWLCQTAYAAGQTGQSLHGWDATNSQLEGVIKLACSGQGWSTTIPE